MAIFEKKKLGEMGSASFGTCMSIFRTKLFIVLSSIALLAVLIIQVNWIVGTARIKEEIFNEKANIVIAKTAEALSADTTTCRQMEACMGKSEIHKTDSLFSNFMSFYDLKMDYSFEVKKPGENGSNAQGKLANNVYKKRLDEEATKYGLELNLFLPEKRQFIIEEMGPMFITSVLLIIVVLVLFWRTILLLTKEKELSEHTTEFLNNMTHEFKTPLTNIALAGKMISKEVNVNQAEKVKYYSEIILEENEKLRQQVEQVLSMAALERGEIPLQKTEFDMHSIIEKLVNQTRLQIENKSGNLEFSPGAINSIVFGDQEHLSHAIGNLIDNAIKYSKEQPEISIRTLNEADQLVIKISDKGIGIEKKYRKQIFEKYFRIPTGNVHDVKGFGLGLAYIKKIVTMHDGEIEMESVVHQGTTFTISLPVVRKA